MAIIKCEDGAIDYTLEGNLQAMNSVVRATNRQKKLLRFFGVPINSTCTDGAAGWEIAAIMSNEECRKQWKSYLFLTKDFDTTTDKLKPYDPAELKSVHVPADWSSSDAIREFREEIVNNFLQDQSPFDRPQPEVFFLKRVFMFTGKFAFGTRKACQDAVTSRGGTAPDYKMVTHLIHYLVIGVEGSKAWKHGAYGNKIETAILARREHGSPAIISETHWSSAFQPK